MKVMVYIDYDEILFWKIWFDYVLISSLILGTIWLSLGLAKT